MQGYYPLLGLDSCVRCTVFDSTTCPPGSVVKRCSGNNARDSSCDLRCDPATKPLLHSVWILGIVVAAVDDDDGAASGTTARPATQDEQAAGVPNEACVWTCVDGYKRVVSMAGNEQCRKIQ